jgi:hypothetical protein
MIQILHDMQAEQESTAVPLAKQVYEFDHKVATVSNVLDLTIRTTVPATDCPTYTRCLHALLASTALKRTQFHNWTNSMKADSYTVSIVLYLLLSGLAFAVVQRHAQQIPRHGSQ